jgi:spermidine synthase
MRWYFGFFVVSGFCSLVYEVVWLRLAMAGFGVTTPCVSIVLSVFMAGIALGSWAAGWLTRRLGAVPPRLALRLYAAVEAVIGVSGIAVPGELEWGRTLLAERAVAWDSSTYYLGSGACIALTLLPYCIAMGATFPLAMAAMRSMLGERAKPSFSYLYVANVLGATAGTIGSALVLIELFGFRGTLLVAAMLNGLLAASALALSFRSPSAAPAAPVAPPRRDRVVAAAPPPDRTAALLCLFLTGLISMGLEVVWIRQFTPYLGTVVYTFAGILAVYLLATLIGSRLYRGVVEARGTGRSSAWAGFVWMLFGLTALLPLAATDPRLPLPGEIRLVLGIAPFCVGAGFVTPMLVDRRAGADPDRAGRAYAVNVIGCILGPLLSGFWLLPWLGERWSLVVLSLPLFALGLVAVRAPERLASLAVLERPRASTVFAAAVIVSVILFPLTRSFETQFPEAQVRRDHTATVVASGTGLHKHLLVNGQGMAALSPIAKMMAHLPLAALDRPPQDALVVALGMGTTFRSLATWDIRVTAVELVPSVPTLFGFFHADAANVVRSPFARIVVDDGRRFLERSADRYDVITIDPPPPPTAAGSSLLHSREFYAVAKRRLREDGILQQWVLSRDPGTVASMTRALMESFPHVRVFRSLEGWGAHFLARMTPIELPSAAVLASRLPERAQADLIEWGPAQTPEEQFRRMLDHELVLTQLIAPAPDVPTLSDDRPYNEYFFLRWYLAGLR